MGLDVYLYTAAQHAAFEAHDQASNAFYERPDYGDLTGEQKDEISATILPYAHQVDVKSERFPEHYFNRRYLRSSYNGSGFNRAVPDFIGDPDRGSFYWIFEPLGRKWDYGEDEPDPGVLTADDLPKLEQCKANIDDAKALEMTRKAASGASPSALGNWWSGQGLNWFGGTLKVIAAVPGGSGSFRSMLAGGGPSMWPCVHLVYKAEGDGFDSYIESAEIVAEFCDEAMSLIEQDGSAYISWSG